MEITINAFLVNGFGNIDTFLVKVDELNYLKIKRKLELENTKAINILKELKKEGKIKSIFKPKNWLIKKELNEIIKAKKNIKKSIEKINEVYK